MYLHLYDTKQASNSTGANWKTSQLSENGITQFSKLNKKNIIRIFSAIGSMRWSTGITTSSKIYHTYTISKQ